MQNSIEQSVAAAAANPSKRAAYLIETSDVEELLQSADPRIRIINASLAPDARAEHEASRLTETTQYFSVKEISQPGSDLPNTLPSAEVFAQHMQAMRVRKDDIIICYDSVGM